MAAGADESASADFLGNRMVHYKWLGILRSRNWLVSEHSNDAENRVYLAWHPLDAGNAGKNRHIRRCNRRPALTVSGRYPNACDGAEQVQTADCTYKARMAEISRTRLPKA